MSNAKVFTMTISWIVSLLQSHTRVISSRVFSPQYLHVKNIFFSFSWILTSVFNDSFSNTNHDRCREISFELTQGATNPDVQKGYCSDFDALFVIIFIQVFSMVVHVVKFII